MRYGVYRICVNILNTTILFFFFQAEDGIRDRNVTGVQTCALPILASGDEPAVLVRDLTGRITAWIEVGAPDAARLHRGSKLAGRAALYTHRDPAQLLAQYAGSRTHRAAELPVYAFARAPTAALAAKLARRAK